MTLERIRQIKRELKCKDKLTVVISHEEAFNLAVDLGLDDVNGHIVEGVTIEIGCETC